MSPQYIQLKKNFKRLPLSLPIHLSGAYHHHGLLHCKAVRSEAFLGIHISDCSTVAAVPSSYLARVPLLTSGPENHGEEQYYG